MVAPVGGQPPKTENHHKNVPQDHSGLTGVLSEVVMQFQNAEALRPVVAAQRDAGRETRNQDRFPTTSQQVILSASTFE